jgi:exonuclease III
MQIKVVTWNCNGAFRNKYQLLTGLDADILVIQECEDPKQSADLDYRSWAVNYIWIGDSKHKGLGIFCKQGIQLLDNGWENNGTKHFISAKINNSFDLVAVWTKRNNSVTYRYIGQFWKYLQENKNRMKDCLILGDFNSNKIWDRKRSVCNHSEVVRELHEIGIVSLYHEKYDMQQGEEAHPTFYLQRNLQKPYHIDYIFMSKHCVNNVLDFEIGPMETWLNVSDHLPVIAVLDLP